MKNKVIAIIGARPQFIKHCPFELAAKDTLSLKSIHTGQHYDENMSNVFFEQLGMSKPDYQLSIGSSSHGKQTALMMIEIEEICFKEQPDALLVYGDTNSTLAGALVASKLHIPIIHVEAGLRSFNKEMPEEVNRILTDHISDLLFVPSQPSVVNLKNEGIEKGVHVVGDIMKDLVHRVVKNDMSIAPKNKNPFYYATLHRPYNVDEKIRLTQILSVFNDLDEKVYFSIHPRTRNKMVSFDLNEKNYTNISFLDPQGYLENLGMLEKCKSFITDSGGMQKEAYWINKKCITIRSETEWKETLENNANTLIFKDLSLLKNKVKNIDPISWDKDLYGHGNSATIMIELINQYLTKQKG